MLRYELREYTTSEGRSPFNDWLEGLRDIQARARIESRLDRVRLGNLGDYAPVGSDVFELRLFHRPGYRVYHSFESNNVLLLLLGGKRVHRNGMLKLPRITWLTTGSGIVATSRSYQESLIKRLKDPEEAAAYLDAALEAGDRAAFLLAIKNVIDAFGGVTRISRDTGLNRENLYRVLSERGNPELISLEKLLKALGLRLSVEVDRNMGHAA